MIVASTIVPDLSSSRFCSSSERIWAKIDCVRACFSSKCRKRRIVVSSGTASSISSIPAKRRIDSESYRESSIAGSDRLNHCCMK